MDREKGEEYQGQNYVMDLCSRKRHSTVNFLRTLLVGKDSSNTFNFLHIRKGQSAPKHTNVLGNYIHTAKTPKKVGMARKTYCFTELYNVAKKLSKKGSRMKL